MIRSQPNFKAYFKRFIWNLPGLLLPFTYSHGWHKAIIPFDSMSCRVLKAKQIEQETGRQQRARHVKNTRSCHSQLSVYPGAVYQYTHKCQSHASAEVETGREIETRGEREGEGDTGNASQALGEHMSKGVSEGLQ